MHYGIPQGFESDDGTVGEPIILNGKNMSYLDVKYVGKEVAVFTWTQVVGGLPMPDGNTVNVSIVTANAVIQERKIRFNDVSESFAITVGANNLLDIYPDLVPDDYTSSGRFLY